MIKINAAARLTASQDSAAKEVAAILKKLGVKFVRSGSELVDLAKFKGELLYNVGSAKSINKGNQGTPEGELLFVFVNGNTYDFTERELKSAGTSTEKLTALLKEVGFKLKKTLTKRFG